MTKKVVPKKTEEEQKLYCDYVYWLKTNSIVPDYIVDQFKVDSLRIKNTNPIYKQL